MLHGAIFKDPVFIQNLVNDHKNINIYCVCMFSVCVIDCVCKEGTAGVCVCLWKEGLKQK